MGFGFHFCHWGGSGPSWVGSIDPLGVCCEVWNQVDVSRSLGYCGSWWGLHGSNLSGAFHRFSVGLRPGEFEARVNSLWLLSPMIRMLWCAGYSDTFLSWPGLMEWDRTSWTSLWSPCAWVPMKQSPVCWCIFANECGSVHLSVVITLWPINVSVNARVVWFLPPGHPLLIHNH